MATRLYVGNLNFKTTEDDLTEFFSKDGMQVVSCRVITDRETGRSRGFGFVELGSEEEAKKVIETMDGVECDGRALRINYAKEREPRSGGGGGGGRSYGNRY